MSFIHAKDTMKEGVYYSAPVDITFRTDEQKKVGAVRGPDSTIVVLINCMLLKHPKLSRICVKTTVVQALKCITFWG